MITIKFLGGAKKSFSTDSLEIEKNDITVEQLLDHLLEKISKGNTLDMKNLLVAINGIDSSAIDGKLTKLKNNDVVSIIPIIHGGSQRIHFKIVNTNVELFDIQAKQKLGIDFLDNVRKKFPNLVIQAISSNYILSKSHAEKIISISYLARQNQSLLSKKIDTDILLRFAGTTQIQDAIKRVGIKQGKDFVIIAAGKKLDVNKLYDFLKPYLNNKPLSNNNQLFLRKKFKISKKHIDSIASKNQLEDLLIEKATILI